MEKSLLTALLSASLILSSHFAQAAELNFPHLQTVGYSELAVPADMAEINVQVSVKEKTAKAAKDASDKAVAQFIARLKKAGITQDKINSANLNLQPQYNYQKNKPAELIGYSANRTITVIVDKLSHLNEILDSALEEGINRVNNIALKSSKEKAYKLKARQAAIVDAQQKAKSIAQGFGKEIHGIWQITYMDQSPIQPVMLRMSASSRNDIAQSYQQGLVTISDRINVIYRLK